MNATSAATSLTKPESDEWQGTAGERWAANVDHFEVMLADIGAALLDHADFTPGEHVVEIGCGGGGFTRQMAAQVAPGGTVLGLDISPTLVELATVRATLASVRNVRFVADDAQTGMPDAAPFDRLVSRFGVMFFADPAAAMTNLHAMLKPAGRLDFAVWAPVAGNLWGSAMMEVGRKHLALTPPDPRGPGPFAFSDTEYLTSLLLGGGFTSVRFETWNGYVHIGTPGCSAEDVAELSLATGPLAEPFNQAHDTARSAVRADLSALLQPFLTAEGAAIPASVHLVSAEA
jgi:protein-L-isoaspartate O-methyltransferase